MCLSILCILYVWYLYTISNNLPENITTGQIKLSEDNIKLMSGCEFNSNINILTGQPCLETMQNVNEDVYYMSNFEKGYLFAFTLLTVGLLYKANNKLIFYK